MRTTCYRNKSFRYLIDSQCGGVVSHGDCGHVEDISSDVSDTTLDKGKDGFVEFCDHDGHFIEFIEVLGVLDKLLKA
jgi:hypothetical protein